MRIIAYINEGPLIRDILGHLGEPTSAPSLAPTRGPPLRELPRWPDRPNGKLIRTPSRHQTTNSTGASRGSDGPDKGWGLLQDDSCLKTQGRPNSAGLEFSGDGCALASDISGRNSRLKCREKRGDTSCGGLEFPIFFCESHCPCLGQDAPTLCNRTLSYSCIIRTNTPKKHITGSHRWGRSRS